MSKVFRHGDVLLEMVEEGKVVRGKKLDHLVLANGEVTGHMHKVIGNAVLFQADKGDDMVLDVQEDSIVTHEEHGTKTLKKGTYRILRQAEYAPEGNKYVQD